MSISHSLKELTRQLDAISDSPRLEAELLLAHALNITRTQLYTYHEQILSSEQAQTIETLLQRRLNHEPMAYILGHKEFWSLDLQITPATLIPRPETECLIDWVLQQFPKDEALHVADLGTGSGAIALALAHECPKWMISATDYSSAALVVAQYNAQQLKLSNIKFYEGDWCTALPHKDFHLIISNPPYIAPHDPHLIALQHEPLSALVAAEEGLADLKSIILDAKNYLAPSGCLVLEHGYAQGESVRNILQNERYRHIQTHVDLSGNERFTSGMSRLG